MTDVGWLPAKGGWLPGEKFNNKNKIAVFALLYKNSTIRKGLGPRVKQYAYYNLTLYLKSLLQRFTK